MARVIETLSQVNFRIGKLPRSPGRREFSSLYAGFKILWNEVGGKWLISGRGEVEKNESIALQASEIIVYATKKQIKEWIRNNQLHRHP